MCFAWSNSAHMYSQTYRSVVSVVLWLCASLFPESILQMFDPADRLVSQQEHKLKLNRDFTELWNQSINEDLLGILLQ